MKQSRFFPGFTRQQRKGIITLFVVMLLIQAGYFIFSALDTRTSETKTKDEQEWLALQSRIDELKAKTGNKVSVLYPFNPNFISDYKGYTLGMSVAQINKLHAFRKTGQYVNSVADFKKVTGVHDTLLARISPYFKFSNWVKNKKEPGQYKHYSSQQAEGGKQYAKNEKNTTVLDINEALEEDLDKVYGIGPAFAKKILRRRAQFGGFVSMEQMNDFEDFSSEAIAGLKKQFKVVGQPQVTKLNINTASLSQLAYFPYFNRGIAKAIITRRSMKGKITKIEELLEINDFPVDKEKIIALYLEF